MKETWKIQFSCSVQKKKDWKKLYTSLMENKNEFGEG